eukprot:9114857-Pyramimonas_sp.AAC.2
MIGWIHTDETLSLVPTHRPQLPPEVQERVQSVPWIDDGRFLCSQFHWVRTGFGHCPFCNSPINYKYRVSHDNMLQTWNSDVTPRSLSANGIELHVDSPRELPRERAEWIGARVQRQRRASAIAIDNISSNQQQERRWAN